MEDLVVVVLLNYNQNDYTLKCIESLLKSDYNNFKIYLIDNGSTVENEMELSRKLPKDNRLVYTVLKDNIGYGKGTNYILDKALECDPQYYLIMNNDTIIDKGAIKELVSTSKEYNDEALVTGKVYHYDQPEKLQFVGFRYINKKNLSYVRMGVDEVDNGQYEGTVERDMIDDIFVLHSAKVYKKIGGYSPYFWVNGVNIDRALRAMENGFKLVYTSKAILWHKGSVSIGGRDKNPKIGFWDVQSKLMIRYIHLSKSRFLSSYFRILFNDVSRTYIKSKYYKWFKGEDFTEYANAKFKGLFYFNRWVVLKNENTGYIPK
ncbi:glycosyltransferase family 2 protein [Lutimonas halocynthiae]|uniref:glycosyltransferase family 2 protein n=1 Tax=Lutimonas halocynthiae TaxID=1446477 RepID=UPI0025B2EFDD|nr:glycosyltransferase family 2 protein [Lutimonas halocynthiae]MDN3643379.1 glycosyltransferase family 2 protein [Lutimonas halocynthiae]